MRPRQHKAAHDQKSANRKQTKSPTITPPGNNQRELEEIFNHLCAFSEQTKSCGLFNSNAFESSFQNTSLLLSELTGRNPCGDTQASIRFKSFRESTIDVYTSIFHEPTVHSGAPLYVRKFSPGFEGPHPALRSGATPSRAQGHTIHGSSSAVAGWRSISRRAWKDSGHRQHHPDPNP